MQNFTISLLPLELVDYICNLLPLKTLINNGDFIYSELNRARIQKYWDKTHVFDLIHDDDLYSIKYFVSEKSGKNYGKTDLKNMLFQSCKYGRLEIVKFLISFRPTITVKNNNPLSEAIIHGYSEIVKFLLESPLCCINYNIRHDDHVLIAACIYNQLNILKYLVSQGLDIKPRHSYVLCQAKVLGFNDIVEYLESLDIKFIE